MGELHRRDHTSPARRSAAALSTLAGRHHHRTSWQRRLCYRRHRCPHLLAALNWVAMCRGNRHSQVPRQPRGGDARPIVDRTTEAGNCLTCEYDATAELQTLDAGSWFIRVCRNSAPRRSATSWPRFRTRIHTQSSIWIASSTAWRRSRQSGLRRDRILSLTDSGSGFTIKSTKPPHTSCISKREGYLGRRQLGAPGQFIYRFLNDAQRRLVADGMKARGVYGFDFGDNEADSRSTAR